MKVFLLALVMLVTKPVLGCSYAWPTPLKAVQKLDTLFEGSLHAVYVDGEQVSSANLSDYLHNAYNLHKEEFELLIKVRPDKYYRGQPKEMEEIRTTWRRNFSCSSLTYLYRDTQIWGSTDSETDRYLMALASMSFASLRTTEVYLEQLENTLTASPQPKQVVDFLTHEKEHLTNLISGRKPVSESDFSASRKQLSRLPSILLELRSETMEKLGLKEEAIRTQSTLMLKSTEQ